MNSPNTPSDSLTLPALLIEPAWLFQHLSHPNLRLLDVRLQESYQEAHLPNAAWVDLRSLSHTVDGVEGMLLSLEQYAAQMNRLGVDAQTAVVLYDDNWGMPAARVLWTLARYGHTNAAILNGGWDRWQEEGHPTETAPFTPPPTTFTPQPADNHLAERAWLLPRLDDPNVVIIDTRTPAEFERGHLPGALSWDWMNGAALEGWNTVRPPEEVRAELANLGVTPDKEIVTYCRSGARAAHTYLLLRHLGFPRVRNYDGSWLEWSRYAE
ncbi:MAG: sulfurtransferase [Caldilineaceae bacterium]